jgi:hypothetical protein
LLVGSVDDELSSLGDGPFAVLNLVRFPICNSCFSDVMDIVLQFGILTVLSPSRIKLAALEVLTVMLFVAV